MGSSSTAADVAVTTVSVPPHAAVSGGEGGPTERRHNSRADQRWPRYLAARPRLPPSHHRGGHLHFHRRCAAVTEPRRRHIREPPLRARHTATVFGFRLFASVDYCCCPRCRCWCYWPLLLSPANARANKIYIKIRILSLLTVHNIIHQLDYFIFNYYIFYRI